MLIEIKDVRLHIEKISNPNGEEVVHIYAGKEMMTLSLKQAHILSDMFFMLRQSKI